MDLRNATLHLYSAEEHRARAAELVEDASHELRSDYSMLLHLAAAKHIEHAETLEA